MPNLSTVDIDVTSQVVNHDIQEQQEIYNELQTVLQNKEIRAVFQPIVSLLDGEILAMRP